MPEGPGADLFDMPERAEDISALEMGWKGWVGRCGKSGRHGRLRAGRLKN